jgi:eukaryotic-like serine/threonine-protein kinase
MDFLKFVSSRYFWIHFGLILAISVVVLWLTLRMLDLYTHHGQAMDVPGFKGVHLTELDAFASEHKLRFEIIDSLFDMSLPGGTVIMQDPAPGSQVKSGRKVYLTVVAQKPEQVSMPNLVDLTLRQATAMLETYGLRVGRLHYVPDIAMNAVLMQKFNGKDIVEGAAIEKGSKIDLVLGLGEDKEKTNVPDIIGLKQSEAVRQLKLKSLNIGREVFEHGPDTALSHVYRCVPAPGTGVEMGTTIDIWYREERGRKTN